MMVKITKIFVMIIGGASSVQSARPYHQAIITVESSETLHARDNHGLHIDRFCPEKICFNSSQSLQILTLTFYILSFPKKESLMFCI